MQFALVFIVALTLYTQCLGAIIADCSKNGVRYPSDRSDGACLNDFIECVNGEPKRKSCGTDQVFDPFEFDGRGKGCVKTPIEEFICSYNCTDTSIIKVTIPETPYYGYCLDGVVINQKRCPTVASFVQVNNQEGECEYFKCKRQGNFRIDDRSYMRCESTTDGERGVRVYCPADYVYDQRSQMCVPPKRGSGSSGSSGGGRDRPTRSPCAPCHWWWCDPC